MRQALDPDPHWGGTDSLMRVVDPQHTLKLAVLLKKRLPIIFIYLYL